MTADQQTKAPTTKTPPKEGKSAARMAAVQALYELEMTDAPADDVLAEFMTGRWRQPGSEEAAMDARTMHPPDAKHLKHLVSGVHGAEQRLDPLLVDALKSSSFTLDRIEALLRVVLRAGCFELVEHLQTPARVVISEYMDVAHAFFSNGEPTLVNGALDKVARAVRPGELPESGR